MTTMYLILCQWIGESVVAGVFSTREKAEAEAIRLDDIHDDWHGHRIVAWPVDARDARPADVVVEGHPSRPGRPQG